jgi:hypothetical protein
MAFQFTQGSPGMLGYLKRPLSDPYSRLMMICAQLGPAYLKMRLFLHSLIVGPKCYYDVESSQSVSTLHI